MTALTNYIENQLIDFLFRGQPLTAPTNVWVALFTVAPTDAGGGTEVSGGSYARVEVPCSLAAWAGTQAPGSTAPSIGSNGTTSNNADLTFPTPTALWGTVVAVAVFDAASAGNMLFHGPLAAPLTVNVGNVLRFPAGSLSIQIDTDA